MKETILERIAIYHRITGEYQILDLPTESLETMFWLMRKDWVFPLVTEKRFIKEARTWQVFHARGELYRVVGIWKHLYGMWQLSETHWEESSSGGHWFAVGIAMSAELNNEYPRAKPPVPEEIAKIT